MHMFSEPTTKIVIYKVNFQVPKFGMYGVIDVYPYFVSVS